jgi:hypothetical protein
MFRNRDKKLAKDINIIPGEEVGQKDNYVGNL